MNFSSNNVNYLLVQAPEWEDLLLFVLSDYLKQAVGELHRGRVSLPITLEQRSLYFSSFAGEVEVKPTGGET